MDLDFWKDATEIAKSVVTSVALVIGGLWGYRKLLLEGTHEESLSVTIGTRILPADDKALRILEIRFAMQNTGKVPCRLDLHRSTITVTRVKIDKLDEIINPSATPIIHSAVDVPGTLCNVPVGGVIRRVHFVGVTHPGTFGVRVFLAQSEPAARLFYKRMKLPFPPDWTSHPPGWDDYAIIGTEQPQPDADTIMT